MAKLKSRPDRWADAVSAAKAIYDQMETLKGELETALGEIKSIQEEYGEWKDNLPESMQSGAVADKLEGVCNLDFETDAGDLGAVETLLDEAEGIDLPLGFGRD